MTSPDQIRERVGRYYADRLAAHGPTPQGVDWNSGESQRLRFLQLLRLLDTSESTAEYTVNDYGCGYGALVPVLAECGFDVLYRGFDLSPEMVDQARSTYRKEPRVTFVDREDDLGIADYTLASGIFNVKLDVRSEDWEAYILRTLETFGQLSARGFAFNMLTSYSDQELMRPDLYYGDPLFYFDHCKRRFSRDIALLHDYGLYEFTLIVRNRG